MPPIAPMLGSRAAASSTCSHSSARTLSSGRHSATTDRSLVLRRRARSSTSAVAGPPTRRVRSKPSTGALTRLYIRPPPFDVWCGWWAWSDAELADEGAHLGGEVDEVFAGGAGLVAGVGGGVGG